MNQGGKHAASEPTRLDNKRDRRRGAAGRAAALRRAPSDSDCSGETASLSADSGDRAPRPAPLVPPRSAKTRSRRRGSEWEVLEGLKDGQRFEKRPDVFNGYLHKKRKWPLKGWHKRFFVVDGGILVYARSPTDVARGRLHGSVDVGLSVISAKARRRRIDIDADEFIYHLRAKTPEVFRTWLSVLKAHRLYRQHLLTFGARESAPKIHAPLEDLPATDTSSRTSVSTNTSTDTSKDNSIPDPSTSPIPKPPLKIESSVYDNKDQTSIFNWQLDTLSKGSLVPHNFEENLFDLKFEEIMNHNHRSMCSMNCIARRFHGKMDLIKGKEFIKSPVSTEAEKQIIWADLEKNTLKNVNKYSPTNQQQTKTPMANKIDSPAKTVVQISTSNEAINSKKPPGSRDYGGSPFSSLRERTTECYFFTRKKCRTEHHVSLMRRSRKCTNLVKYRNLSSEPPLKMPSSRCMLLGKYKLTKSQHIVTEKPVNRAIACETIQKGINASVLLLKKGDKDTQNATTTVDYDIITQNLLVSILQRYCQTANGDVKYYIDHIVKDLYDIKLDHEMHPIKALFRNLLDYWLRNTSIPEFKEAIISEKSVDRPSNKYFTKDEKLSSLYMKMKSKETQHHGFSNLNMRYQSTNTPRLKGKTNTQMEVKPLPIPTSPRRDTESFEKERRIQELEKLLQSTVYMCETRNNNINKEKDIKITKKLIDNLDKLSRHDTLSNSVEQPRVLEKSSSSAELPQIQETINHLIEDTSMPPNVAKEFLGAYLNFLLQNSSKSISTSQSSDRLKQSHDIPQCDVIAEAVVKKVSKNVTTVKAVDEPQILADIPKNNAITTTEEIDPGQVYLKDILDKVTTIFTKVKKIEDSTLQKNKTKESHKAVECKVTKTAKDELGRPVHQSKRDLIYENCDDNSLVVDLSKYNLEHISLFNDPAIKGAISITIKLKEKLPNYGESKQPHLNLKFSEEGDPINIKDMDKSEAWLPFLAREMSESSDFFATNLLNPSLDLGINGEAIGLKPYISSDGTSKGYRLYNESWYSLANHPNADNHNIKQSGLEKIDNDDPKSCYIMSIKKGPLGSKLQTKKKSNPKVSNDLSIKSREPSPSKLTGTSKPEEILMLEKAAPKIIDEKFILLLLENLTVLSRNVPTLHKDLQALYLKLKKRHEKVVKNCSTTQGLSLLGRIYSDDPCTKDGDDQGTQSDTPANRSKYNRNAYTNTDTPDVEDKYIYASIPETVLVNTEVQTPTVKGFSAPNNETDFIESILEAQAKYSASTREKMVVTHTEMIHIDAMEQSTSNPTWAHRATKEMKECGVSTAIKCVINEDCPYKEKKQLSLVKPFFIFQRACMKNPKIRELIREISRLSDNAAAKSQNGQLTCDVEKCLETKSNVRQLFLSNEYGVKKTSSMTISSGVGGGNSDEIRTLYRCSSEPSYCSGLFSPTTPTLRGPQAGFVSGTPGGRLAGWIIESGGPLESASRELGQAQLSVQQLQRLLDALELQHQVHHDTDVSIEGASPNVKKDRRKFGLRKKKSNSKCASVELAPPHIDPSSSHTALSSLSALTAPPSPGGGASSMPNSAASLPIACAAARPQSLPGAESLNTAQGPASLTSLTPDHQLREDFTVLAKDLVTSLKSILSTMVMERGRLRAAMESAEGAAPGGAVLAALRTNLSSALQLNSELRTRLSRIHDASDIAEICSVNNSDAVSRHIQQSLSYSSSCVSASEFFDAEEHDDDLKPDEVIAADEAGVIELDGDSSSEAGSLSSEEGSASSDNSDGATVSRDQPPARQCGWSRRTRLPAPRPQPGGPSLWNLLYKNIGKDLSQISMPVTINEPLNMLQRLCEELEYSELLDTAAECKSAVERMSLIAAFAVSAYAASAHRAASKPFNPLLGETYECVRDDRDFRFLAEQVSHHPPISACHAESPRWCFWQEARIKTKFWGKSMEFQPTGRVHVKLLTTGDHYTWNKVTTCVHNLFGGQRWVDQYGDMHIVCVGTELSCKLNFIKASSWSQSRHEVRGTVCSGSGRVRVSGRWSEALYVGEPPAARCLWRPGAMPPEHELYYGFTRFAMELNELEPGMTEILPHTDTRLRPDQRALEEGSVETAEQLKHELEQAQRDRRRDSPAHTAAWFRKTLEEGEETWVFTGEYWKAREAGFSDDVAPRIW